MTEAVKEKGSFDWLATVLYPLAVVLMEVFWVYPWLVWLGSWPIFGGGRPVLSLASVVVTLAVSLLVTRLALRQAWSLGRLRAVIIGGGLVFILIVLGVDFRAGYGFLSGPWFAYLGRTLGAAFKSPGPIVPAIPVLLYLWWRGIVLGQTTSYFRDIYRTFILGMVALVVLIIFWQISATSERFTGPGGEIGLYVMGFFFFGLTAIALCHIYVMRRSMPREEAALTSMWRWLPIMLGVIGGMVLVGFGVASIFSPDIFDSIGRGLSAIGAFLGKAVTYILWPLFFVLEWLIRFVKYILSLLRGQSPPAENATLNQPQQMFPDVTPANIPPWVTEAIKWFVVALIVGLVLFILAKAVSRIRARRMRDEIEEIHESLFSWRGLRDDLKELLGMMGGRFRRKPVGPGYIFDEDAAGMDIREIYKHVLWEGSRSGIARRRYETAAEYSARLGKNVPESGEPLDDITGLYQNVRYGDKKLPEAQVDSANSCWQKLRWLIRKVREI
jgi:hypothetical protein